MVLAVAFSGRALAFHSGGVGECEGCHTMHNSFEGSALELEGTGGLIGTAIGLQQFQAGPYLLKGSDQSSACLNCHQGDRGTNSSSYHVATPDASMPQGTPPNNYTPGGDFGWLKKTWTWVRDDGNPASPSKAERHGHNIIAADYGFVQDSTLAAAPGGDQFQYPSAALHCSSCHDPHGRYRLQADNGVFSTGGKPIYTSSSYGSTATTWGAVGAYRLLGGIGYQPKSLPGSYAFAYAPMIAVAPSDYNRPETQGTDQVIVAYGLRSAFFCANCHPMMHAGTPNALFVHTVDAAMFSDVLNTYNAYKKSGDLTNTDPTKSYLSLVPFQRDGTFSINTLRNNFVGKTTGPGSGDRVTCLSCHRAHASGFDSMTRFGLANEFITVADSNGNPIWPDPAVNPAQAVGRTVAETQAAYYGRPATVFAPYQRALCNKCHGKD